MHTSYTVGITTGEYKALTTVMIDQQDWVTNALKNQARKTTLDITRKYTQFKIDRSEAITAVGSTAIIEAAIAEGVVGLATDVSPSPEK
tara:strand:+ start:297 stop:563 length:267 start_codon:yes stop_codon:yes gene_type:complete